MLKYFDMLKEAGSVKAAQIDTSTIATAPWTIYKCRYGCDFYGKELLLSASRADMERNAGKSLTVIIMGFFLI